MKLYFAPGACSLASHIVLRELGLPFEAVQGDLRSKKTQSGEDYAALNPKGYVPGLQLDAGRLLSEGPAILQYLADRKPEAKLAPAAGTFERYQLQEWLAYINSEVHKTYSGVFNPAATAEQKEALEAAGIPYRETGPTMYRTLRSSGSVGERRLRRQFLDRGR